MTGSSMGTLLAASTLLLCQMSGIRSDGYLVRPPLIWATHVTREGLTHEYTASTFTPNEDVVVTRVQAQLEVPGQACAVNPAIAVSNSTSSLTLTLATLANDTGPVKTGFARRVSRSR